MISLEVLSLEVKHRLTSIDLYNCYQNSSTHNLSAFTSPLSSLMKNFVTSDLISKTVNLQNLNHCPCNIHGISCPPIKCWLIYIERTCSRIGYRLEPVAARLAGATLTYQSLHIQSFRVVIKSSPLSYRLPFKYSV